MKRRLIPIIIAVLMAFGPGGSAFADDQTPAGASPRAGETPAAMETGDGTEPSTEPSTEPTTEPTTEPATEPTTQPTTQPATTQQTVPSLKKPAISSLWNSGIKKVSVKWALDVNAGGYEIYCKQAKKKKKIVKAQPTGQLELKGLKKGKKYTIKIRSFRKQGGKTIRSKWSKAKTIKTWRTDWNQKLNKYSGNDSVHELMLVKYKGNSRARLYLYQKDEHNKWVKVMDCKAYVGQRGIDKKKEGDRKTPTGDFDITHAFGIKSDPGSKMDYIKVNRNHYWCADKYYNKLIDISQKKHDCKGEHLITYTKQYAYAMNIGYNTAGKKGKGACIFLHCFGNYKFTMGCVAVSQSNMIKILQTCGPGTKICIHRE